MMLEFMLIGRGGQGVVLAGDILAKALFYQGYCVKSFPAFGTERRGAPVRAFLRVSNKPISESYQVYKPHYSLVFHHSQNKEVPLGSLTLINSKETSLSQDYFLDANKIALKNNLGTETNPIINTALLGGITALLEGLEFKNLEKAITETLPKKFHCNNLKSAYQAFEAMGQHLHHQQVWSLYCA